MDKSTLEPGEFRELVGVSAVESMHIVIVSDREAGGGASVAASRLAEGLCAIGHRVTYLTYSPNGLQHPWATVSVTPSVALDFGLRVVRRILGSRFHRYLASAHACHRLEHLLTALRPDLVNVHSLHSASEAGWGPAFLGICCQYAPTVSTLHDMWSFTGRCAYSYDCRAFITGCDVSCPTPTEIPAFVPELISGAWVQRRKLLSEHPRLMAVTPSRWLAKEAVTGLWDGHRVEVIPYGVPLDVYQPVDRTLARTALGIDATDQVLLAVAPDLTERRKGGDILVEAMHSMQYPSPGDTTLLTMGRGSLPIQRSGLQVKHLDYVSVEKTKVLAYSAADLLIHPAPVDNLPNVIMEAIACGTPVVGFRTGGVPDMIRPGKTGWLVDEISGRALARTIERALADISRGSDLRDSCRAIAEGEYALEMQARRYSDVFQSLLCTDEVSE